MEALRDETDDLEDDFFRGRRSLLLAEDVVTTVAVSSTTFGGLVGGGCCGCFLALPNNGLPRRPKRLCRLRDPPLGNNDPRRSTMVILEAFDCESVLSWNASKQNGLGGVDWQIDSESKKPILAEMYRTIGEAELFRLSHLVLPKIGHKNCALFCQTPKATKKNTSIAVSEQTHNELIETHNELIEHLFGNRTKKSLIARSPRKNCEISPRNGATQHQYKHFKRTIVSSSLFSTTAPS